jgi:hypothetical protein
MFNTFHPDYRELANQIILKAVEDYHRGHKEDVCQFANTEWFSVLAEISGIDPINARSKLQSGRLQKATLKRDEVCLS